VRLPVEDQRIDCPADIVAIAPVSSSKLKSGATTVRSRQGIVVDGMNERPRKVTRLTVSLEEQDYRTLNEIALARDASVSWVIGQAMRLFIEITPKPPDQPAPPRSSYEGHDR
jgi:hypothetical protein